MARLIGTPASWWRVLGSLYRVYSHVSPLVFRFALSCRALVRRERGIIQRRTDETGGGVGGGRGFTASGDIVLEFTEFPSLLS